MNDKMNQIYTELSSQKFSLCHTEFSQIQVKVLRKRRLKDGHFDHDLLVNMQTKFGHYLQMYDIQPILNENFMQSENDRYQKLLKYDSENRDSTSIQISESKFIVVIIIILVLIIFTVCPFIRKKTSNRKCMK